MNSRLYIDSMNAKKKNDEYIHSITGDFLDKVLYLSNKNCNSFYDHYNRKLLEELNEKDLESLYETGSINASLDSISISGNYYGKDYSSLNKVTIDSDNNIKFEKKVIGCDPYTRITDIRMNGVNMVILSTIKRDGKRIKVSMPLVINNKNLNNIILGDIKSIRNNLNNKNMGVKGYDRK